MARSRFYSKLMKKDWNIFKELLVDLIIVAWAVFFTWHFLMIRKYGAIMVMENNSWILWFELIACPIIGILGLERFIKDIIHFIKENKK